MSKVRGIIPVVLAMVLLLCSSCNSLSAPAVSKPLESLHLSAVTPSPVHTPFPAATPLPAAVHVSPSQSHMPASFPTPQEESETLYWEDNAPCDWAQLPPPEISEADMQIFNPDRIAEYLAACPDVYHDYIIITGAWKDSKFYITVSDYIYSDRGTQVGQYLKYKFNMTDDDILRLPMFSGFYYEDGWLCSEDGDDFFGIGKLLYEDVPVSEDAYILYLNTDTHEKYEVTTQEFADILLDNGGLFYFDFEYTDGQVTAMYQYQEGEEDEGNEYEEEGD